MPFPETYAEVERFVRELVAAKCAAVEDVGRVFTQRRTILGRADYVEKLGIERGADGDVEVRALFIEFIGFDDTERGCEEAPHYYLNYYLRAVREFVDEREDASSSSEEFFAFVMRLREAFLTNRDMGYPEHLRHDALRQRAPLDVNDDEWTGVFGHIGEFLLRVEVMPHG